MYIINKDELAHYGIIGMKWGHRKLDATTGTGLRGRLRGAALDYNTNRQAVIKRAVNGTSTLESRIVDAPSKLIMGQEAFHKMAETTLAQAVAQHKRIVAGKTTLGDKLEFFGTVPVIDLIVTRKDNKG